MLPVFKAAALNPGTNLFIAVVCPANPLAKASLTCTTDPYPAALTSKAVAKASWLKVIDAVMFNNF
jgi:hypothetical protein